MFGTLTYCSSPNNRCSIEMNNRVRIGVCLLFFFVENNSFERMTEQTYLKKKKISSIISNKTSTSDSFMTFDSYLFSPKIVHDQENE